MNSQPVQFLLTNREVTRAYLRDKYELRRDRGWVWLQKLLFFLLRKIGAYAWRDEVTYTKMVLEPLPFMEALLRQQRELMVTYAREGERLLIGTEEFHQLLSQVSPPYITYPLEFTLDYALYVNGEQAYYARAGYVPSSKYDARVCGLKISVIPWMKGMLVLPKDPNGH